MVFNTIYILHRYLKRKREHDIFISNERAEFDIGKQHLANMMVIFRIFGFKL